MKKFINRCFLPLVLVLLCVFFVACDQKKCYCFERDIAEHLHEQVTYVNPDVRCSTLGNDSRGCVESSERYDSSFDPNLIAK